MVVVVVVVVDVLVVVVVVVVTPEIYIKGQVKYFCPKTDMYVCTLEEKDTVRHCVT